MSLKFTEEIRKEDSNFILHDNTEVCTVEPGRQAQGGWTALLPVPRLSWALCCTFVTRSWGAAEAGGVTDWLPAGRRAVGFPLGPSQMKKICQHLAPWIHPTVIVLPHLPPMTWRKHIQGIGRLWTLIFLKVFLIVPTSTLTGQGFYHWSSAIQYLIEFTA